MSARPLAPPVTRTASSSPGIPPDDDAGPRMSWYCIAPVRIRPPRREHREGIDQLDGRRRRCARQDGDSARRRRVDPSDTLGETLRSSRRWASARVASKRVLLAGV